jgi:hypothetical protein
MNDKRNTKEIKAIRGREYTELRQKKKAKVEHWFECKIPKRYESCNTC